MPFAAAAGCAHTSEAKHTRTKAVPSGTAHETLAYGGGACPEKLLRLRLLQPALRLRGTSQKYIWLAYRLKRWKQKLSFSFTLGAHSGAHNGSRRRPRWPIFFFLATLPRDGWRDDGKHNRSTRLGEKGTRRSVHTRKAGVGRCRNCCSREKLRKMGASTEKCRGRGFSNCHN